MNCLYLVEDVSKNTNRKTYSEAVGQLLEVWWNTYSEVVGQLLEVWWNTYSEVVGPTS